MPSEDDSEPQLTSWPEGTASPQPPMLSQPPTSSEEGPTNTVDPRWYDDPRDPDRVWVWDGRQWTPHAREMPTPWYGVAITITVSALAVFVWLYAMIK
jgi:hypothetical protein